MSAKSKIEWTEATWNPWHGCHKISPGCKNCYMYRDKLRYGQDPNVVVRSKTRFNEPLKWKEPKLIFTCSWSDWFIREADSWRGEAYDVIRRTPDHTYQILTKRSERLNEPGLWPGDLANVWLGVSVESKDYLYRIDDLRRAPAAVRFLSLEPLLENLGPLNLEGIHWVIVGGESGKGARPVHPDWVTNIRHQCVAAGIPFFFKQWGAFGPITCDDRHGVFGDHATCWVNREDATVASAKDGPREWDWPMVRVGKKLAGRLLGGREWNEMPEAK